MKEVRMVQEKQILNRFFEEVTTDSGFFCFGIKNVMNAIENKAIKNLIINDEFDIKIYTY